MLVVAGEVENDPKSDHIRGTVDGVRVSNDKYRTTTSWSYGPVMVQAKAFLMEEEPPEG